MNNEFWTLLKRLPELDQKIFRETINSYRENFNHEDVDELRKSSIERFPILQNNHYSKDLDFEAFLTKNSLIKRPDYDENIMSSIKNVKTSLENKFPSSKYRLEHRVSTVERVLEKEKINHARVHMDTVGFRVVPFNASDVIKVAEWLEKQQKWNVLLKLNTIASDPQDFKNILEPHSSPFYRAIHYYIDIGHVCAEIQIHTPAISQWSKLHHRTHYKPQVQTTDHEKELIMEFGKIANWVDFKALCS